MDLKDLMRDLEGWGKWAQVRPPNEILRYSVFPDGTRQVTYSAFGAYKSHVGWIRWGYLNVQFGTSLYDQLPPNWLPILVPRKRVLPYQDPIGSS